MEVIFNVNRHVVLIKYRHLAFNKERGPTHIKKDIKEDRVDLFDFDY